MRNPPEGWRINLRSGRSPGFSLYDLFVVTDDQIQEWADEAETGYDVEKLTRRGRGRPGRGAEPMQVVAVRLTVEELEALDKMAEKAHMSRSETIRRALADFAGASHEKWIWSGSTR